MENPWIIYFFIVLWLGNYGIWFVLYLGSIGWCLQGCWIYYLVGKAAWDVIRIALYGGPFLIVSCGAGGGKEMPSVLEGCERNIFDLKLLLLKTLFDWMLATGLFSFKIVFGILWSLYCLVIILSTSIKHTPSVLDASLWSIKFYYLLKKKKERDSHGCLSFPTILHPNMLLFFIYFLNIFLLFPYTY